MANGLSDDAIESILNFIFSTGTAVKPTGLKLHLYKGDPHTSGQEVSAIVDDTLYAPQSIAFGVEGAVQDRRVYNSGFIGFAPVAYGTGAAPYNVTHWAVKDGSEVMLAGGAMPSTIQRLAGEPLGFNIGAIFIEFSRT